MVFPNDILIRIILFILGVCGFFIAKYIYKHKQEGAPLVCPIGFDCHTVVHSDYSKFMGMRVEILGMVYYAFVSLAYFCLIFIPKALPVPMIAFSVLLSLAAFIFSIYLIAVQVFILKKGCSWCLVSAAISVVIFLLITFASGFFSLIPTLFQ